MLAFVGNDHYYFWLLLAGLRGPYCDESDSESCWCVLGMQEPTCLVPGQTATIPLVLAVFALPPDVVAPVSVLVRIAP